MLNFNFSIYILTWLVCRHRWVMLKLQVYSGLPVFKKMTVKHFFRVLSCWICEKSVENNLYHRPTVQSNSPWRHQAWLHPSFFNSSTASLWACKHTNTHQLNATCTQKPVRRSFVVLWLHLFIFQRAGRVIFGLPQPHQSFLFVLHGHVGLPKHQQVFAVEVWINWIQITQLCSISTFKITTQSLSV